MGSPSADNKLASFIDSMIKIVVDGLVKLAVKYVEGQYPWLNIYPINRFLEALARRAVDKISDPIQSVADKIVIGHQVDSQVKESDKATENLQTAIQNGDPNAIKQASDDFDKALGDLVHYDGSAKH